MSLTLRLSTISKQDSAENVRINELWSNIVNLTLTDWSIVVIVFLMVGVIAIYTNRYTCSVADFLSANRCAGRYLLGGAELMAMVSATMFIGQFEQYYKGGFPVFWWMISLTLISLIKALSGWVQYRFRETRALTMAQFFEMRYSKRFRVFAGMLAWLSGIINFAIHPAVTSRLLVYFCGLPLTTNLFGFEISTTIVVMFIMLSVGVTLALAGGQIALMITDWFQGQILLVVSLIVVSFLLLKFGWGEISTTLKAAPADESMLNPFKQAKVEDFNVWFFAMLAFFHFYQEMAFQGNQGYFSAAKNPHEAKMARIFGIWRSIPTYLFYFTPAIIAYVVFNSPNYTEQAGVIQNLIEQIPDKQMQGQMRIPLTLVHFLPTGLMGLLTAVFIASSLSTDDTYLHAWGSIFIQDVVLPLRKKERLTTKKHLKLLRISIVSIAVFALVVGSLIPIRDYVLMYFQITFAIYAGGAGAVIIGGLYWKRGTTAGAWSAIITGAILCTAGFVMKIVWTQIPALTEITPQFPLNGVQSTFISSITSVLVYIIVSLLNNKPDYNLDKMLHRGKYDIEGDHTAIKEKVSLFRRLTGIDKEFTKVDKIVAIVATCWILFWTISVWGGMAYYYSYGISDDQWCWWWGFVVGLYLVVGASTFIWYFIGGVFDVRSLFHDLKNAVRDENDDGMVVESKDSEPDSVE